MSIREKMFRWNYLGDPSGKTEDMCGKCSANVTVCVGDTALNVDL